MATLTESERVDLEQAIDSTSLEHVVQVLIDICHGKAEHLRSNWQDNNAAKAWEHDVRLLSGVHSRLFC